MSLLGVAESFLSLRPPDVKAALRCLQAVLVLQPANPIITAGHICRLDTGQLLRKETKNQDLAKHNLEQLLKLPAIFETLVEILEMVFMIGISSFMKIIY